RGSRRAGLGRVEDGQVVQLTLQAGGVLDHSSVDELRLGVEAAQTGVLAGAAGPGLLTRGTIRPVEDHANPRQKALDGGRPPGVELARDLAKDLAVLLPFGPAPLRFRLAAVGGLD